MSKIPFLFETPVPKYFRENGWFECEHMFKFVTWAFSRCQTQPHKKVIEGKEITLQPFEFISGRLTSPKECFLTENIFRNQQLKLQKAGLLKKTTNSLTNHFSCYIWVTDAFLINDNQPKNQPLTNHQPTVNHKERTKNKEHVVVTGKILGKKEVMNNDQITKSDVYLFSLRSKYDWTPEEIEEAWGVFSKKENISEPFSYIEGIIKNKRIINETKEQKICKNNTKTMNHKKYSNSNHKNIKTSYEAEKENFSEKDLKMRTLQI